MKKESKKTTKEISASEGKKNLHEAHRNRLREKFKSDPSLLEDHEMLELLLFFSIPRKNTNEIAHNLLKRFHDVQNIFNAEMSTLTMVDGVGENTAVLFRVVSELNRRYELCRNDRKEELFMNEENLKKYLCSLFTGKQSEEAYILLFDASFTLLCYKKLSEGFSCGTPFPVRDMIYFAIANNAASVVLAHNHPGGKAIPSREDIFANNNIRRIFRDVGVNFIEHYIVAGNACEPISKTSDEDLLFFLQD